MTIFPDGRLAVSFLDSTTTMRHPVHGMENFAPAIAIEGDSALGERIPPPEEEEPPVMGEPYVSYTFDESDDDWATTGIPTWTRGRRAPRPAPTTRPRRASASKAPCT